MKRLLMMIGTAAVACGAHAASVTIDRVTQRWPWNNKVDITYTVNEGQDVEAGLYCRLVFNANVNGETYVIDGVTNVGASASSGTHTITWNPPSGVKTANCTMTAQLIEADKPSGDDYMVVNILDGKVWYEGLLKDQAASNERYNTILYKTTNMVFRKIARTCDSGLEYYRTGTDPSAESVAITLNNSSISNTLASRVIYKDYYVGVFPVTQWQYNEIYGSNPSWYNVDYEENGVVVDNHWYRPVDYPQWNHARPTLCVTQAVALATERSSAGNSKGGFLGQLNYRTKLGAGVTGFDYPTKMMMEIAARGGVNARYPWGSDTLSPSEAKNYILVNALKSSDGAMTRTNGTRTVGLKLPNNIGLYDFLGPVKVWCLDCVKANSPYDFATAVTDIFKPIWNGNDTDHRISTARSFGPVYSTSTKDCDPSYTSSRAHNSGYREWGIRVAFIPE